MDKKQQALDDIFGNDPLGLLKLKTRTKAKTTDQRLIDSFEEINKFIDDNNRLPEDDMSNISEMQLHAILEGLKNNSDKIKQLKEYDRHNLLPLMEEKESISIGPKREFKKKVNPLKEINSIDDIFGDDSLGILGGDDAGLFDFKHVKKETERSETDFVARRKPCKDFDKYDAKFKQVHQELREGIRKITNFNIRTFQEKQYYIHNGLLFYLEEINIDRKDHYKKDGTRVRKDGRTRCIFENGTESNMLMRSVEKMLYKNGKSITESSENYDKKLLENYGILKKEDEIGGFIYILKSKSTDPEIAGIKNLYKIGFCTTTVEQRIKDADKEPTYLMSPVRYISSWKCINMNANTFENLIHKVFSNVCLDITVTDLNGKTYRPKEWFVAPYEIIEQAIALIITGQIINYTYDRSLQQLVINNQKDLNTDI